MRTLHTVSTGLLAVIIRLLSVEWVPKNTYMISGKKIHSIILLINRSAKVTLITVFYPMVVFFSIWFVNLSYTWTL